MEKVKTYYPYIDGLKGIAILLMVMAHALAWSYPDIQFLSYRFCDMTTFEFNSSFVWKIIYSFHMPLLFAVSGFLFYKPISYDWNTSKNLLNKRIIRILIPYVVTGGLVYLLKGYFGYWFLQILFVVNVLVVIEFLILYYLKASLKIELLSHLLLYGALYVACKLIDNISIPPEFNNISGLNGYYLAFMLGVLIKKHAVFEEYLSKSWVSFCCFLGYIIVFALVNSKFHIPLVGILTPILAIAFLYSACKTCDFQIGGGKILTLIGKNSLEIYILHLFFVMPFQEVGSYILRQPYFPMSVTLQIIYSLTISVIAIYLSIIFANFLKKNQLLSKLIFGI